MVKDKAAYRAYKARWFRAYLAKKHGGITWPRGRPPKNRVWPPDVKKLPCIYCTMIIGDIYHLKHPCRGVSMIFSDNEESESRLD